MAPPETHYLMPMDPEVRELLDGTADTMVEVLGITRGEAVARMNAKWEHLSFHGDDGYLMTHELPYYWALRVFYRDVPDWSTDADRSSWEVNPLPDDPRYWTEGR